MTRSAIVSVATLLAACSPQSDLPPPSSTSAASTINSTNPGDAGDSEQDTGDVPDTESEGEAESTSGETSGETGADSGSDSGTSTGAGTGSGTTTGG